MNWYLKVLNQYTDFNGRASRTEYWMFTLFNVIFSIMCVLIDGKVGVSLLDGVPYGYFTLLYSLAIFLPSLAVSVRRLHDIGKNGWWYLVGLIPLIGGVWLLILFATESMSQENEYGPVPEA